MRDPKYWKSSHQLMGPVDKWIRGGLGVGCGTCMASVLTLLILRPVGRADCSIATSSSSALSLHVVRVAMSSA